MRLTTQLLFGASLVQNTLSVVTFAPSTNGPKYQVAIPSTSSISASSAGPLYISFSAPSSYQWIALGTGTQMAGSTILIIYTDGTGNVTISGRSGRGEFLPQEDSTVQSGLTLLEGSGVADGVMTANVKCTTCKLQSEKASTASPWIASWKQGKALDSADTNADLAQHDAHTSITFDLTEAVVESDSNPFVASAVTNPSGSSSGTASGSNPSDTGNASSGDSDDGSSGAIEVSSGSAGPVVTYDKAHGITMGITVVLLFPIGAMLMRLGLPYYIHSLFQLFSLVALIAGFGLGVHLAKITDQFYKAEGYTHTVFGTVIFALFLAQPLGGIAHHLAYKKYLSRTPISHVHIWMGRVIMLLAVINGGLGLKLAANTSGGKIAYGVIAGVIGVAYTAVVVLKRKRTADTTPGFKGLGGRKTEQRIGDETSQVEMR
ncbi:integral membrane protein-like protein [Calycina marina]|uniref:Integral membrane protein-like protein n=1 Tax=Calycina marina TaxID=1763456 RepID=A0A9P7YZA8_9HELO|nr:integral membrane protein-like protein [Calycina marina]